MHIAITGANGNLGSALVYTAIRNGHTATALTRHNLADLDRILAGRVDTAGPATIVHCAYCLQSKIEDDPCRMMDSNLMLTARLLEACRTSSVKRFVYVSSAAVYAVKPSIYGQIKRINESMVRSFCERHRITPVIARVFNLYGGTDKFSFIHKLETAITCGTPLMVCNDGLDWRDFIHVDDAAKAIIGLATTLNLKQDTSDVGTGVATQIIDLVDRARTLFPSLRILTSQRTGERYSCADPGTIQRFLPQGFINLRTWQTMRLEQIHQSA